MNKKYYVAYFHNQNKIAGMDDNAGGYPFPTDLPNEFRIWSNLDELIIYIKTCNYSKDLTDKHFLCPREFTWQISYP